MKKTIRTYSCERKMAPIWGYVDCSPKDVAELPVPARVRFVNQGDVFIADGEQIRFQNYNIPIARHSEITEWRIEEFKLHNRNFIGKQLIIEVPDKIIDDSTIEVEAILKPKRKPKGTKTDSVSKKQSQ